MPKQEFGIPSKKAYPMPDKGHAVNAKARAAQMENEGKLSSVEKTKIDAMANKVIGKEKQPERHPQNHAEFERLGK